MTTLGAFFAFVFVLCLAVYAIRQITRKRPPADEPLQHLLRNPHPPKGWNCTCPVCCPGKYVNPWPPLNQSGWTIETTRNTDKEN